MSRTIKGYVMSGKPPSPLVEARCVYCDMSPLTLHYENVRDRLDIVPGQWSFYVCRNCASLQLHPLPTRDILRDAYPQNYCFSTNGSISNAISIFRDLQQLLFYRPLYVAQTRRVLSKLDTHRYSPKPKLLDVGCGKAERLKYFQSAGFEVHGLDLMPENVDWVNNTLQIPAVCGDAQRIAEYFPQKRFHVITAFALFEHLLDPRDFVEQCRGILYPGGSLVVLVPIIDSLQAQLFRSRWAEVREAPRHVTLPSRRGLCLLLDKAGYREVSFLPDSSLNGAALVGTSLFPRAVSAWARSRHHWLWRMLAICATTIALPFCFFEWVLLRSSATVIIIARTPAPESEER